MIYFSKKITKRIQGNFMIMSHLYFSTKFVAGFFP